MLLSVVDTCPGMHPSEKLVSVQTRDGIEQLFVDSNVVKDNKIPVSYPLGHTNDHQLVELPSETLRGIWRIWVSMNDLTK